MGKKIGIDLGTTYSCVSYVDDEGVVKIVDNIEGEQTTPSIVYFDSQNSDSVVVGSTARNAGASNPENLVERVKNYMGNADYKFFANGNEYSAAAVSTLILKKLISDTEQAIGEEIEGAVITCPAYFGEEAKNATKVAGENVVLSNGKNLKVLKILDEPTAAAIAYGYSKKEDMKKTVLIYDLGGGTFDCTVMKISFENSKRDMQVITTNGNHQLGGKDWDQILTDLVVNKYCATTGVDPEEMKNDPDTKVWLSENIEKAKRFLTSRDATSLSPSYNGQREKVEITRQEFDEATHSKLEETFLLVDSMLSEKGLTMEKDIDEIILVGGSTYMPQVSLGLTERYKKPISTYEPNKAVAMGAALVASDCVETTSEIGGVTQNGKPASLTITNAKTGDSTVIHEICTKSYGLRFSNKETKKYQVLNLILKDSEKPNKGSSGDHFALTFYDNPEPISEISILILENESQDEVVEMEECKDIYLEEPIKFDGAVPGTNEVSVELSIDANSLLTLKLLDLVTGKEYKMNPKRKTDEANQVGMDLIKKMTLQ